MPSDNFWCASVFQHSCRVNWDLMFRKGHESYASKQYRKVMGHSVDMTLSIWSGLIRFCNQISKWEWGTTRFCHSIEYMLHLTGPNISNLIMTSIIRKCLLSEDSCRNVMSVDRGLLGWDQFDNVVPIWITCHRDRNIGASILT